MAQAKPTFDQKLAAMLRDLGSIAERMNRDGQPDIATDTQNCINAVSALKSRHESWFADLDWDWQPSDDDSP